ncbi:MAG: ABC transporter substrate-binding protein [Eubacteriales bacterium]|nr:ABC transporter substrate-binding protein [Eubacteriales bacterium]
MKKICAAVLTGAMMVGLVACGSSKESAETEADSGDQKELAKITFCLDWTPNTNHTGLYAAKALGYYEEAGLDVEIVQPPENGASIMCASGQAQFAVEAQDTLAVAFDQDEPLEITAVAGLIQHNTSGIISRKGDGIDTPKGLEGKTYSTWESPVEMAMMQHVVEADGGDFSKVNLIPNDITDEPAALAANQTDAIWIFYGWGGVNADIEGVEIDYWNFKDIDPVLDYYTPIIVANNDFLEENPDTAKAFMEATKKGYEYAIENPEEAADMLIEGDETGSLRGCEDLVYASQKWLSEQYIADGDRWGYIAPERWDGFYTWLFENDLTSKDLTGIGYSNDYLPE